MVKAKERRQEDIIVASLVGGGSLGLLIDGMTDQKLGPVGVVSALAFGAGVGILLSRG